MAKVTVAGNAIVITSSMRFGDLSLVKRYQPDALVLKGGDDGKEPIFCIDIDPGRAGNINVFGASFGEETRDEGLATMTLVADFGDKDPAEFVADFLGEALRSLNKLEETLPGVVESVNNDREKIINDVTVIQ